MNARVQHQVTGRLSLRPPQAESLTKLAEIQQFLDNVRGVIGKCVEVMPSHSRYIAEHCAAVRPGS